MRSSQLSSAQLARNIIILAVFWAALTISAPLLIPVGMGGVLAILLFPWMVWLERHKIRTHSGSLLLIFGMTVLCLAPTTILFLVGARAAFHQVRMWRDAPLAPGGSVVESMVGSPLFQSWLERISRWFPVNLDEVGEAAGDVAKGVGLKIADALGSFLTHLPAMAVATAIMVIATYFFLVDGREFVAFLRRHSVFSAVKTEHIFRSFAGTCRSVIVATLLSGLVQSGLYTVTYLFAGGANAALIGFLIFLASFVPLVGAAPITFGVALSQLVIGHQAVGTVLLVAAVVVSFVDNVVRPVILKGSANLHPLLAFVGVFGGLQTLGFVGVFIGPIVVALSISVLRAILEPDLAGAGAPAAK